ncbi:MAG TPA: oxidoreductase, partial [Flavobacteriaceae bacterium]|nr:oxidoreductase [Flavobacteriaceae bacterium]
GGDHNHMAVNEANKAMTFDGGKTWKLVNDKRNPGYISSVKFVPGGHGKSIVGVGESGVYFYNNDKDDWHKLSNDSFHAIEFVNDSVAFASGKGRIVRLVFKETY